jgi:phosphate transport system substrate-binding protein
VNRKVIVLLSGIILFSAGCTVQNEITYIKIKGSDTMHILAMRWAEEYMLSNKHVSIYVEGGGSAQGIKSLINSEIDICTSSRPMLPSEVRQLAAQHNRLGIAHFVAKDALSVYTHSANPVRNLSMKDLDEIFTGKITNWLEFDPSFDSDINVISRSPNSGTYLYFKEHVLHDKPYLTDAAVRYSTNEVVKAVVADSAAIGYGGTAFGDEVIHLRIDGISPTLENVNNDSYPIVRYLYLYTIDKPGGEIKKFIDWILDEPGQAVVAKVGYIPLWTHRGQSR